MNLIRAIEAHILRNIHLYWNPFVGVLIMWGTVWAGYVLYPTDPDHRADTEGVGPLVMQAILILTLTVMTERLLLWDFGTQLTWDAASWKSQAVNGLLRILLLACWICFFLRNH